MSLTSKKGNFVKKITLKQIIYKNYLKTTLTSILFIELALLILYFNANKNILEKSTNFVLKDVRTSVYDRVRDIKYQINNSFLEIENNLKLLQNEHQNFFEQIDNLKINKDVKFDYSKNGMYYKTDDNGGSSVIVSNITNITNNLLTELKKTEYIDKSLKLSVENDDVVLAGYFNSKHNYSRYYPYLEESYNVFPSNFNMENYNFYYKADLKNNPEKNAVWTDVYLDPAGFGWMVSAIVPIYKNHLLEGVVGFDITINKLLNKFLSYKIPYDGKSFLIDNNLNIIAMNNNIMKILEIENFDTKEYRKNEKIANTIFRNENPNLKFKNKELRDILKDITENKNYKHEFFVGKNKYFLFSEKIDRLPWHTITIVKEDDVLKDVKGLEDEYISLGLMIILFIVLFYLIFFIYLYKKANDFVYLINKPLLKVIYMTKTLGIKKTHTKLNDCGIVEIDELSKNFNKLANELNIRTKELIETEASRALHKKLSNTDALTKVYNRRFLEDFSKKYFEIVKREKSTLSILLVDIDNFKSINDSFGHDVGDQVLQELVKLMQDKTRENDFIVRLGGDEFLILLPNSDIVGARVVAHKLLNCEKKINVNDNKFTISIGCAQYKIDDVNIDYLIKRADIALYEVKKAGKNNVV